MNIFSVQRIKMENVTHSLCNGGIKFINLLFFGTMFSDLCEKNRTIFYCLELYRRKSSILSTKILVDIYLADSKSLK